MNEGLDRLQRMLEQATAAEGDPQDESDPETARLREAWLAFGQLLEENSPLLPGQMLEKISPLLSGQFLEKISPLLPGQFLEKISPLLPGEGQGVRAERPWISVAPRQPPRRRRRWLVSAAGLVAASLLIGIVTAWMLGDSQPQTGTSPVPQQTAATKGPAATPTGEQTLPAPVANGPQWDDSLDEQFAQLGQQITNASNDPYSGIDAFGSVRDRMEKIRQEIQADTL